MKFEGILFDFDGVLLESEYAGNAHLAETLTALGHPVTTEESMAHFMGLAGQDFLDAITARIGHPIPDGFAAIRAAEDRRAMDEGIDAVAGAIAFVRSLPADVPRAIASSSSTAWIERHLAHMGIRDVFGANIFSGREHVPRGKPAPDVYLHAAKAIGIDIARAVILEDSPVGVTGAVASGAYVIGLVAGQHCAPDHADRLRALGVQEIARDFDEVARLIG